MAAIASKESRRLRDLFKEYGLRPATINLMSQMGFTVSTLINMKDEEVDFLIKAMMEDYHLELLMGEQFGIKSAVRAKQRLQEQELERQRVEASTRRRAAENFSTASPGVLGLPSTEGGQSPAFKPPRIRKRNHIPPELLGHSLPGLGNQLALVSQGDTPLGLTGLVTLADVSSDGEGDSVWDKTRVHS